MTNKTNVIALDVGDRRIGVAVASLEAKLASPLLTIDRQKVTDIYQTVATIVSEHEAGTVIVGLPRGMSGQETLQTASAREFADKLAEALGIQVELQDEAATSIMAEEELKTSGKPYQKGDIDKLAATYILSDWLSTKIDGK